MINKYPMRLTYETGIATTIQLIAMTALNFINAVSTSIGQCTTSGSDCAGNIITNLLFFMLVTVWFIFIWVVGFAAQDRRSRRLSQLLMLAEFFTAAVALFDLIHRSSSFWGEISSFIDAALAVWVLYLAYRLMRAKGGRVVSHKRAEPRPRVRRRA